MFQDYENFPCEFYSESLSRKDFGNIRNYSGYKTFARDIFISDCIFEDGHVLCNDY